MEKTTVYLTTEQKAALGRLAEVEGRSEARLIREGVDAVIAGHQAGELPPALARESLEGTSPASASATSLERPRWIDRDAFLGSILRQADAGLRAELRDLAPGTTDDEPPR